MLPWLPPYEVELKVWGGKFADLAFGAGVNLLVSERFRDAYLGTELTGLLPFTAVSIRKIIPRRLSNSAPTYFFTSVVQGTAAIDDARSGLVREGKQICPKCRIGGIIKRTSRLILEENTWSGEDVFIARGLPGTIVVTDRFKEFYDFNNLTGGEFIPVEDYSFDFYPGKD